MITILKNDAIRMLTKKSVLISMAVLIAGAIIAAIFFTSKAEPAIRTAYVADGEISRLDTPFLDITVLTEKPPMSELVSGTFDAIVIPLPNGRYEIETIKSNLSEEIMISYLEGQHAPADRGHYTRGRGAAIISYLLMFLLMEGSVLMCLFGEDKEHRQITRITASPLTILKYLAAHYLFDFLSLSGMTLFILYFIKWISGIDIGYSAGTYTLLIVLANALAAAFSLFLNALTAKSDHANMVGAALIVMTTVLSGSFYSFEKNNALLEKLIRILPQRSYLTLAENIEQKGTLAGSGLQLSYLLLLIFIFIVTAIIKTRKEYVQGN